MHKNRFGVRALGTGALLASELGTVLLALASVSCGSHGEPAPDGAHSAGSQVGAGGAQGDFDGSAASCSSDLAVEGCACDGTRASAACWTGPAADRRRGACRDGTATCVQRGEFHVWGPCEGEVLDCRGGHHLVATWTEGQSARLVLNGGDDGNTGALTLTLDARWGLPDGAPERFVAIGDHSNPTAWDYDEAAIWDHPLAPAEIAALYAAQRPPNGKPLSALCPGIVGGGVHDAGAE